MDQQRTRHAFLVLCHKQPRQLNALFDLFGHAGGRAHVYAHVDARFSPVREAIRPRPWLRVLSVYPVHWGGFNMVRATLALLHEAVSRENYAYVHLLSGQCLPLQPLESLMDRVEAGGMEYMHCTPFPVEGLPYKGFDRILVDYPADAPRRYRGARAAAFEAYKESVLKDPKRRRKVDHLPPLYHGSQWFSITGACAVHLLEQAGRHPEYAAFFETSLIPDEMFFQTLLMHSPFAARVSGETFRLMDWKRGGPYTFTVEDLPGLLAAPQWFARKFDIGRDEAVVARLTAALALRQQRPGLGSEELAEAVKDVECLDAG